MKAEATTLLHGEGEGSAVPVGLFDGNPVTGFAPTLVAHLTLPPFGAMMRCL